MPAKQTHSLVTVIRLIRSTDKRDLDNRRSTVLNLALTSQ
jgi:hypothetical protein